jgi:ribosomal protein S18 acetylase RimI-like enzyme
MYPHECCTMNPSPPDVVVRAATAEDVPAVLPMVQAICDMHAAMDPQRYGFVPEIASKYGSWLPKRAVDPTSVFLVAQSQRPHDRSALVGFLIAESLDEIHIYKLRRYGFVHDLWVEPTHRRMGVAQLLVQACLASFRSLGVTQVRLDTAHANDGARALFTSVGFRPSTMQMLTTL